MTTDNRTNELSKIRQNDAKHFAYTEAQVEAAARALYRVEGAIEARGIGLLSYQESDRTFKERARAALVAAQGATPQAEGECDNHRLVQHRDGKPPWCNACGLGRPVQPSSTVDEGKIAEVVRGLRFNDAGCWAGGIDCTESVSDHADEIARAVVEAIGGESR